MDNQLEKTSLGSKSLIKQSVQAEELISQAIDKNLPVENLERLLAFAKEVKAIQAKQEFDRAMANFQADCPTIEKRKEVKSGNQVLYKYAPIESIVEQVKPYLKNNGFSYSTKVKVLPTGVEATVKVTHIEGHSEESSMEVPLGNKTQIMSASQQTAAASTFAKRYAFCNAFGILTGDEDNDGQTLAEPTKVIKTPVMTKSEATEPDINEIVPGNPPVNLIGTTFESYLKQINEAKTLAELKGYWENVKFLGHTVGAGQKALLRSAIRAKQVELEGK